VNSAPDGIPLIGEVRKWVGSLPRVAHRLRQNDPLVWTEAHGLGQRRALDAAGRSFPTGMTSHVYEFDAREGGLIRISLTYNAPTGTGKTTAHTDTYHGCFVKLVPNEQVVEVVEFETADPALQGELTITFTLADADPGTDVLAVHDSLPLGLSPADNEVGWRMSLAKLATLVEAGLG
jgi:uncharacterized protein YndB with AHSA1/START domain